MKLYKVLVDGRSCHGGDMVWSLPHHDGKVWQPGEWHQHTGEVSICSSGIHGTADPRIWLKPGCQVYRMEAEGIKAWNDDKFVCDRARLLRPCHLPFWWRRTELFIRSISRVRFFCPDGNPEPSWRVFTARTWSAARDAARDAAWTAAWPAAWPAAWDAAWAAEWDAAWDAAWAAARDAAWSAARDAAWTAAWDAEWDAAWAAARDAARDAALLTRVIICDGLQLRPKYKQHAHARWRVWRNGYALLCDVNGQLFVYAKEK